ncbi:MAG: ACP S-malonyltransferase [Gammaproteobacteria bacterium]|nr:ACP S-malonyltransferase [Gammaproteobacteria bacterium]MCD8573681.1 ACP S-malonyltransferase [Gammaproteobacteria bacterium]
MKEYSLVFPGQGSQSLNMLASFSSHSSLVDHYCQRASDVLGYDIASLIANGPEERLNQTEYTQPALLVAGVIAWKIWTSHTQRLPTFVAGHSLGEYTALTCAGVIDFEDAVNLVRLRGQFMQNAVPVGEGAMAAIVGLDNDDVLRLCSTIARSEELSPANFNSIGQVVIAGKRAAVESAVSSAKNAGAKIATLLPMSVPSHCHLMLPAAEKLRDALSEIHFSLPNVPVINNVDVMVEISVEKIKSALVRQLYSPVRWVETIQLLSSHGVNAVIECGPGKVLSGLIKRIDKSLQVFSIVQEERLKEFLLEEGKSSC